MQNLKEIIEGKIDILKTIKSHVSTKEYEVIDDFIEVLKQELQSAKSIEDISIKIQEKAFEAGLGLTQDNWEEEDLDKWNNYLKRNK